MITRSVKAGLYWCSLWQNYLPFLQKLNTRERSRRIRFGAAYQRPRFLILFGNLKKGVIQRRAGVGGQRGSKVGEEGGCDPLSPSFPQGPTFNATVQLSLETSNQAFEFVTSLLKALENENSNLKLRKYYARKKAHYTGIMLDATTITLYPELCRHNASNLSFKTWQVWFSSHLSSPRRVMVTFPVIPVDSISMRWLHPINESNR